VPPRARRSRFLLHLDGLAREGVSRSSLSVGVCLIALARPHLLSAVVVVRRVVEGGGIDRDRLRLHSPSQARPAETLVLRRHGREPLPVQPRHPSPRGRALPVLRRQHQPSRNGCTSLRGRHLPGASLRDPDPGLTNRHQLHPGTALGTADELRGGHEPEPQLCDEHRLSSPPCDTPTPHTRGVNRTPEEHTSERTGEGKMHALATEEKGAGRVLGHTTPRPRDPG
jgi:hypothetical protein